MNLSLKKVGNKTLNTMIYRTQYHPIHPVYIKEETFIGPEYILEITIS